MSLQTTKVNRKFYINHLLSSSEKHKMKSLIFSCSYPSAKLTLKSSKSWLVRQTLTKTEWLKNFLH